MHPVVSIDLGAAYTKLAVRRRPTSHTELLAHDLLHLDEQHICIPSVAAWNADSDRWVFGVDAVDLQSGAGIHVYRNWKPHLFNADGSSPASANGTMPSVPQMAVEYFRWLRETFVPETMGVAVSDDPIARLCVPDFSVGTPQEQRIEAILREAGWRTQTAFCISEPLASLTGALSNGKNCVDLDEAGVPHPLVEEIFAGSEFCNFLRKQPAATERYEVLIIDIGAYTADFGLVRLSDEPQNTFPQCHTQSLPLGIFALDEHVCETLPEAKAEAIRNLSTTDRERYRQVVYGIGMPWRLTADLQIGMGPEAKLIAHGIHWLADAIGDALDAFLDQHEVRSVQEVVLSGGGNGIPRMVHRLTERLAPSGVLGYHLALCEEIPGEAHTFPLSQPVIRGASAIGGASVLFDH